MFFYATNKMNLVANESGIHGRHNRLIHKIFYTLSFELTLYIYIYILIMSFSCIFTQLCCKFVKKFQQ